VKSKKGPKKEKHKTGAIMDEYPHYLLTFFFLRRFFFLSKKKKRQKIS